MKRHFTISDLTTLEMDDSFEQFLEENLFDHEGQNSESIHLWEMESFAINKLDPYRCIAINKSFANLFQQIQG